MDPIKKSYQLVSPSKIPIRISYIFRANVVASTLRPKIFLSWPRGIVKAAAWIKPETTDGEIKLTKKPSWRRPNIVKIVPIVKPSKVAK